MYIFSHRGMPVTFVEQNYNCYLLTFTDYFTIYGYINIYIYKIYIQLYFEIVQKRDVA